MKIERRWHTHFVGFPITAAILIAEASKYNEEREIVDGWVPGKKWYYGFLKRHNDISLRTPQYLPVKKTSTTEEQLRNWYSNVCCDCC